MFIIINTVLFGKCQFGGCGKPLCHSILTYKWFCSYWLHFVIEKNYLLNLNAIFLNNCTYLTFDLTVTLNRKITLGIHPYIVCYSPRNTSSLDAEH